MADNTYLLETRLSKDQQTALAAVRDVARARGLTVFLVGGAVRDLIGGTAVRDLDVVVQGNALKLKKDLEKAGGVSVGEMEPGQRLFFSLSRRCANRDRKHADGHLPEAGEGGGEARDHPR